MAKSKLTPEQLIAASWLAQPKCGGKTRAEVAEICNVSTRTLYNWEHNNPDFDLAVKDEMKRRNRDRLPELMDSLVDMAISEKNAAMAKLALQVNDMISSQVSIEKKPMSDDGVDYDKLDEEIAAFSKHFEEEIH